jgi:hypothetical protein
MKSLTPIPWIGFVAATAGAVLMVYSGPLPHAWVGAHLPTGFPVHVNWLLLIGIVTVIGGGLLVQIARENPHG